MYIKRIKPFAHWSLRNTWFSIRVIFSIFIIIISNLSLKKEGALMNGVKFLITLMCIFTLSACTTTNFMWGKSVSKETITSFLITKDNENLIVIGEKHHYIFSVSNNLKTILSSDKRKHLIPYFYYFKVDEKNNITGEYTLLSTTDKLQDNLWLKKAGFKKYTNNKNDIRYK